MLGFLFCYSMIAIMFIIYWWIAFPDILKNIWTFRESFWFSLSIIAYTISAIGGFIFCLLYYFK